jgi:hypothetical protein
MNVNKTCENPASLQKARRRAMAECGEKNTSTDYPQDSRGYPQASAPLQHFTA